MARYGTGIEGKIKVVSSLEPTLKNIKDPVTRSLYVAKVSKKLGIPEDAVFERLKSGQGIGVRRFKRKEEKIKQNNFSKIEISLITALIDLPELKEEFLKNRLVEKIENERLKNSFLKILENSPADPMNLIDTDIQPLIVKNRMEQGTWNIRQAKMLMKQFVYVKKRRGLNH
eukprot:gnl/Chilomastix_cuspidata/10378.p1 GENE.gnl/Chilomastix_cuspidata/10378~~gnl/Chilomastix_cuspidata/10378.p1  ORF type:complete len:192 (-),score=19.17 gnl/Chilomastix_cuspidata/10378:354-869(-)